MTRILSHLLVLLVPASIAAAESFMLLTRDGSITPVQLTIIGPDEVELVDSEQGFGTLPREDCIAFLRPTPSPASIDRPTVLLRDGQRFPGRLSDDWIQDHLVWDHEWLGTLRIPMERLDRVVLAGSSRIQSGPSTTDVDRVHLLNGDVVEGFVLSITPRLEIEVDSDTGPQVMEIPLARVREIDLFGDMEAGTDPRVWTNDGTLATLGVLEVASDGYLRMGDHAFRHGGVSSMLSGPPLRSVHALSCAGARVVPIGSLPVIRQTFPSTRMDPPSPQVTDPAAPLGLSPIEYRGPLMVEYGLPTGPHRLHATVRMPASATRWGDCELVLLVDGNEIHRSTYNADLAEHRLDVVVDGSVLALHLLEGANGPVQDHLRFEYGMLMPEPESAVRTLDESTEGVGGSTGID